MARTRITAEQLPENGQLLGGDGELTFTAADSTNYHDMLNNGRRFLVFRNNNAGTRTVTIYGVTDENSRTANLSVVVPAIASSHDAVCICGPFAEHLYGSLLTFDPPATSTGLQIAAFELPGLI